MNIEKIRNAVNTLEDIENIKVVSNSFSDNDIDKAKYLRIPETVIRFGNIYGNNTTWRKAFEEHIKSFFKDIKEQQVKILKEAGE